jgi:hypothetical protein
MPSIAMLIGFIPPPVFLIVPNGHYNRNVRFSIYQAEAGSILSVTSGFIARAGFTHSLSPASKGLRPLPCAPRRIADLTLAAMDRDLIGDSFQVRAVKKPGAATREAVHRISRVQRS